MLVAQPCTVDAGGHRCFRLAGELDGSGAETLVRALKRCFAMPGDVVLDLIDLVSADDAGVLALAGIARQLDGQLILLSPRPQVTLVLHAAGVAGLPGVVVFHTHDPSARPPPVLDERSPPRPAHVPIVPI